MCESLRLNLRKFGSYKIFGAEFTVLCMPSTACIMPNKIKEAQASAFKPVGGNS